LCFAFLKGEGYLPFSRLTDTIFFFHCKSLNSFFGDLKKNLLPDSFAKQIALLSPSPSAFPGLWPQGVQNREGDIFNGAKTLEGTPIVVFFRPVSQGHKAFGG
jgi:hypothetical protein